jgi:hypothetical protein
MEQKNTNSLEIKGFEIILWTLPGFFYLLDLIFTHRLGFLFSEAGVMSDLFFAFSPVLFAILFSLIYNNFPIYHLTELIKKEKAKKE